jgi:hypothetical protein
MRVRSRPSPIATSFRVWQSTAPLADETARRTELDLTQTVPETHDHRPQAQRMPVRGPLELGEHLRIDHPGVGGGAVAAVQRVEQPAEQRGDLGRPAAARQRAVVLGDDDPARGVRSAERALGLRGRVGRARHAGHRSHQAQRERRWGHTAGTPLMALRFRAALGRGLFGGHALGAGRIAERDSLAGRLRPVHGAVGGVDQRLGVVAVLG